MITSRILIIMYQLSISLNLLASHVLYLNYIYTKLIHVNSGHYELLLNGIKYIN